MLIIPMEEGEAIVAGIMITIRPGNWLALKDINSLASGRCGSNFEGIIFKLIIQNSRLDSHYKIALGWMPQNFTYEKSSLVQVMAWCHRCYLLNQCRPILNWIHGEKNGSHTFSETKFKDFLRTFHGQNYIFQALWNRYLAYCRCVILW